jgi:lipoprotein-releasing system ATP-binding protein
MIQAKDIYKSFGQLQVLKGIDLDIERGEVVSIVGRSGAGKTTLLQILGTLDKPDFTAAAGPDGKKVAYAPQILIGGTDVLQLGDKELSAFRCRHIGFVFQFHQLLPEFSALENIMMPALIAGTSHSQAKMRAQELLDFLGLKERATHRPNELSGGEKQRVAVARALMNKPDVIFADEPSGSLDTQNKQELHQLFFDLRKQLGQTFVIVTHDESLAQMSDRIIHMKDGKIV